VAKPERLGKVIKGMFGGFIPDSETVTMARQYRKQHLPKQGICQVRTKYVRGLGQRLVEGCMAIKAFKEICRQINEQKIEPQKVCEACTYWECPIKKGTVIVDSL
jgi:hypothetical protein